MPALIDVAAVEALTSERDALRGELEQLRLASGFVEPGHYYSPAPTLEDARTAASRPAPTSLPGIDLNRDVQITLAAALGGFAADQPFGHQHENGRRYRLDNDFFAHDDGLILHAMMRHYQPSRIIEIGSGWSSACMLDTDDLFLDRSTKFVFIDPEPERLESLLAGDEAPPRVQILRKRLQDIDPDVFSTLSRGDLLFIDSSHVVKAGSDVLMLSLEVIPTLPVGTLVHFHDIGWPFQYPLQWADERRWWNEAYLIHALLINNSRLRVLWFHSYMAQFEATVLHEAFPALQGSGMSLWMEIVDG